MPLLFYFEAWRASNGMTQSSTLQQINKGNWHFAQCVSKGIVNIDRLQCHLFEKPTVLDLSSIALQNAADSMVQERTVSVRPSRYSRVIDAS